MLATLQNKLHQAREERAEKDHGFTLIELLVVVVIIGILVAIAIPLYSNYKDGAANDAAKADARNAVPAIEQCFQDNTSTYPATMAAITAQTVLVGTGTPNPCANDKLNVSTGNTLTYTNNGGSPVTFSVAVKAAGTGKTWTYRSADGSIS